MLESQDGPGGLRSAPGVSVCSPWGLKAALGSCSDWVWGLMVPPGVLEWSWGSQGCWMLRAQGGPRGLKAALGSHSVWIWGLRWPWGLTMVLGISGQLDTGVSGWPQGSQCAASEVSRQPWGLRVLGYGGSGEPQDLRVAPGVLQWPLGISGQLDTEVSVQAQGSQCSPRALRAALGSHSAWVWGLRRAPRS